MKQQRVFQASLFKQYLKAKLIALLDSIPGKKLLMLDITVRNPINLIIQKKVFAEHGIPQEGGIINFQPIKIDVNFNQIVIFLPPTITSMEALQKLYEINKDRGNKIYYPVFWPKRTSACKQYLQNAGLLSSFQLKDFSFDLIPLDNDLYSLQMKSFKELYIQQDYTVLTSVAQAIHRLQCVFGKVRNIFGKGNFARNVFQILQIKQNEIKIDQNYGEIEHLIMLDRNIDFITPLLKQMTYQGMIDEFYGINGNFVKLPSQMIDEPKQKKNENQNPYKTIALNGQKDFVYQEIRIYNIAACRNILKAKAQLLDAFQAQAKNIQDINQKKQATKRITVQKQLLRKHINISSALNQSMKMISFHKQLMLTQRCIMGSSEKQILDYYENLIPFGWPLEKLMRPLCLYSIVEKGINKKIFKSLYNQIIQCYGGQHIISLSNLSKLGLFCQQGVNIFPFTQIKKQLKLINDQTINHQNPKDISFAYAGYSCLTGKLVQNAIRFGWKNMIKGLKMIPGEILMPDNIVPCPNIAKPVVLVFFIGGCTYGEIAAVRFLGKILKKQMIIATTQILNGQTMLKSLIQKQ